MPFTLRRRRRRELDFSRSLIDIVTSKFTTSHRSNDNNTKKRSYHDRDHPSILTRISHTSIKGHRIHRLPNELLAHIFVLGAEDDAALPFTVSHVCRLWRYLALHTPSLWRRIALDLRQHMWREHISRAKACTLDIQLLLPRSPISRELTHYRALDVHVVQLYMHLVTSYIYRWRTLEIRFDRYAPYLWNAALSGCCERGPQVEAPYLHELSLVYAHNDDTKEFTLFNGHAPRLRRVTLHGIRLAWLPSLFLNLTHLDYTHHGFTRGYDAAAEVLRMLQVSTRLTVLAISFPWRGPSSGAPLSYSSPPPSLHPIVLRRLLKLELKVTEGNIPSAFLYVLNHLSLPSLCTLRLLAAAAYPFFPRPRTFLKALPPLTLLETLYVQHSWADPRFLAPFLCTLPRLRHLTLDGPHVTPPVLAAIVDILQVRTCQLGVFELVNCGVSVETIADVTRRRLVGVVSVLYVRECVGVGLAALKKLSAAGVRSRLWVRGTEISVPDLGRQ